MAGDKKKKNTVYQKKADSEFRKGTNNAFIGGSSAYQPRDANTGKPGHGSAGKSQAEKSMRAHQETFGQKVQKSGSGQSQENRSFSEHKSMD